MNYSLASLNRNGLRFAQTPSYFRLVRLVTAEMCAVLSVILLVLSSGCQSTSSLPKQLVGQVPGLLAPGDVLKIAFPGAPELSQVQKIRSDGKVSLPQIGQVNAGGKRLGTFQDELSRLYKSKLTNTEVVVSLESSAIPVYVSGAVNIPGKVILDRPMTVLEAIMEAGGPSNLANVKKVIVVRNANGKHYTEAFDLSPPLRGQTTGVFYLRPYDMIIVPERFF